MNETDTCNVYAGIRPIVHYVRYFIVNNSYLNFPALITMINNNKLRPYTDKVKIS